MMDPIAILKESGFVHRDWYLQQYPDVGVLGMHPAEHYYRIGARLGRNPGKTFDTEFYLERYPDVADSGMNPLLHYVLHGAAEGRHARENSLDLLADKLWSGHAPTAISALQSKLNSETAPLMERCLAAWHLARWIVFQGDFEHGLQLAEQMAQLVPVQELAKHRVLLAANCLIKLQREREAAELLQRYLALEPADPDARLLLANTCDVDSQRLSTINEMYHCQGYLPLQLIDADKPLAFNNISADWRDSDLSIPVAEQREKISIIMPIYAAEERIEIAVRSLLNQTWQNIEIIAVDDCSPDATLTVLQNLADEDERVRVVQQPHNQGAYPARNRGLREATGDYITTHDADDWSHPQKLEQQMVLLRQSPAAKGVILSWVRATDDLHFTINWRPSDSIIHYSHSSFLLARDAAETIGQWDEVRISADTEYIWRTQHEFGKHAILHGLAHVPMALALDDENSLTRTKATHVSTVYFGLRHIYREICRWYHKQGLDRTRKTALPKAMQQKQAAIQQFDYVAVADFLSKRKATEFLQQVRELAEQGHSIALLHWPHLKSRQFRFCDAYFELIHEGLAMPIVFGDRVEADCVWVNDSELLVNPVVATPEFLTSGRVIVKDRANLGAGEHRRQQLQQIEATAIDVFGVGASFEQADIKVTDE